MFIALNPMRGCPDVLFRVLSPMIALAITTGRLSRIQFHCVCENMQNVREFARDYCRDLPVD